MISIINSSSNKNFLDKILKRDQLVSGDIEEAVKRILSDVRVRKDRALRKYTQKFDGVDIKDFLVSQSEIQGAYENTSYDLLKDFALAKKNIENYHKKQLPSSYSISEKKDIILGQLVRPIEKVGIYIPGGSAAYPSTVLMNVIPAKLAGVGEIIMITPPNDDGSIKDSILSAAAISGVDKIYKVGGAQGIAALAFGTESIPKVDKITGPGNAYVTMAKKQVIGHVGIDMIAGPSEVLIIADEEANPRYIAADLIAQAEHDEMASSILLTHWEPLVDKVLSELRLQVKNLKRKKIIEKSLKNYGAIIITQSLRESIDLSNRIAPEHLEILTKNPFGIYRSIKNAGAIFLGEYSPEPLGDYFAGPNHTLPTNSTARFSSPLSVNDFIKKTSLIYYSKNALFKAKDSIARIAEEEGLSAHAASVKIRFEGM